MEWPCWVLLVVISNIEEYVVCCNGSERANRKKMQVMTGLELQVEAAAPLIHAHLRHYHVGVGTAGDTSE